MDGSELESFRFNSFDIEAKNVDGAGYRESAKEEKFVPDPK